MNISSEKLELTGSRILEVTAYGDAAGLPVENWSAEKIKEVYKEVKSLMPANSHPFFSKEYIPGVWSDDTQLSTAMAESLIEANGFDIDLIAESHIKALELTPRVLWKGKLQARGWGGATESSVERLRDGILPEFSGSEQGFGNAILMKMAPLVFWQVAKGTEDEERYYQYDLLTTMTHNTDVARLTTRIHGDFLKNLLLTHYIPNYVYSEPNFGQFIVESTAKHENNLRMNNDTSKLLSFVTYSGELGHRPNKILDHTDRKGFYAPQTLAMAYGAFVLCFGNFESTVYTAVNMGGDTDSTGSIVANMVNFYEKGNIEMPEDANLIDKRKRLQIISENLAKLAVENR